MATMMTHRSLGAGLPVRQARASARLNTIAGASKEGGKSGKLEEIYLGFPKGDYAPREGRKGRVIRDDPAKYPDKDNLGLFIGATGGWAGGEAALVDLKESIKEELAKKPASSKISPKPKSTPKPGQQPIYVGFGKDELELKNKGAKGRVIYDDETKYPGKDDVGVFSGATGGFAGGERGIQGFVETGEVKLRKPGQPGGQQTSPVITAFLVLTAGGVGAVLLSLLYDSFGIEP